MPVCVLDALPLPFVHVQVLLQLELGDRRAVGGLDRYFEALEFPSLFSLIPVNTRVTVSEQLNGDSRHARQVVVDFLQDEGYGWPHARLQLRMEDFLNDAILALDANLHFEGSDTGRLELGIDDGGFVSFFLEIYLEGLHFLVDVSGDGLEDDQDLRELLCDGGLDGVGESSVFVLIMPR